jgi:NAD dependent epimerase/dehydratase family enzyme
MILFAIENIVIRGVFNAVAPVPVTNETLALTLARQMHGNGFIKAHAPEFVLKLMLGDRSVEVLKSATVSSHKIEGAGFEFQFPGIEHALSNIVKNG